MTAATGTRPNDHAAQTQLRFVLTSGSTDLDDGRFVHASVEGQDYQARVATDYAAQDASYT